MGGVVNDGSKRNDNAVKTLLEIEKDKKDDVLLTNAQRKKNKGKVVLDKMGMNKKNLEKVYTSGEAALNYLKKNHLKETFFHIGPPRDFDLFLNFKKNKTNNIK